MAKALQDNFVRRGWESASTDLLVDDDGLTVIVISPRKSPSEAGSADYAEEVPATPASVDVDDALDDSRFSRRRSGERPLHGCRAG